MNFDNDLLFSDEPEEDQGLDTTVDIPDLGVSPDMETSWLDNSILGDSEIYEEPELDITEQVGSNFITNYEVNPDVRARSLDIQAEEQERSGFIYPVEEIEAEPAFNDTMATYQNFIAGVDWSKVPVTGRVLSDNALGPVFMKDAQELADFEQTIGATAESEKPGWAMANILSGYYGSEEAFLLAKLTEGNATEEEIKYYEQVAIKAMRYQPDYFMEDAEGAGLIAKWFANFPSETLVQFGQQLSRMEQTGKEVLEGYGSPENKGYVTEAVRTMYKTELGNAFKEYSQFKDEMGNPYPAEVTLGMAKTYALISTIIETGTDIGTGMLAKTPGFQYLMEIPKGAIKKGAKVYIKDMVKDKAGRKTLAAMGGLFAKASAISGVQEASQQLVQDLLGEQIKARGGEVERMTMKDLVGSAAQSMSKGVQGGGGVQLVQSAPYLMINHLSEQANQRKLQELEDAVMGNLPATKEKAPNQFNQVVSEIVKEHGAPLVIGVQAESFTKYMDTVGMTVEDLAEISPEAAESLVKAQETGGQVEIPTAQFFATFVNSESFNETVAGNVRFHDKMPTVNEAKEINDKLDTVKENPAYDKTYETFLEKLSEVADSDIADAQARVLTHAFLTMGERSGMTPDEMLEAFQLDIAQEDQQRLELETMITQIRQGIEPTDQDIMGMSLQDWAEAGYTKEQAIDAGYVEETITDEEYNNLLASEAPIYRPGAEDVKLSERRQRIDDLKILAEKLGIDLEEGTPQQVAAFIQAQSYDQTATVRAGQETLEKYGLDPGERYKTRVVATALEERQRDLYGLITKTDRSEQALENISDWMVAEVEFEMQNPGQSGVGWYSGKFQAALDKMGDKFPELQTDQDSRDIMTALIAITSDGQKVMPNFAMAMNIYGNFKETGKLKSDKGHSRAASITGNLKKLQGLLEEMSPEELRTFLMQEKTVSELGKIAREKGIKFSTDYQAHVKMPMAAVIFGPKLGAFYANLMGAHGYLTMDRWWSRTFNRYRGTLLTAPTENSLKNFRKQLGDETLSDDQTIAAVIDPHDNYEARGFKTRLALMMGGSEPTKKAEKEKWHEAAKKKAGAEYETLLAEHNLERAANTIWKKAFGEMEDAPFNATDRTFMLDAVNKAQEKLAASGSNISIADIQAILWYYEKRLYGELGTVMTADVSYEEAAARVVAEERDTVLNQAIGTEDYTEFAKDEGQSRRGYITINENKDYFRITLTGQANLSTFMHESGHMFLEMLTKLAGKEDADPSLSRDLDIIKQWVGWSEDQTSFTRDQHERFARGFEAYLMSGKAPTVELQSAFRRFASWLTAIYANLKALRVNMNEDITGVMDRMLASEESIKTMAELRDLKPAFENAEQAGMTGAEWDAYLEEYAEAMASSEEIMRTRLMKEIDQQNRRKVAAARKRIQKDIAKSVAERPVYQAIRFLITGQLEDTNDIPLALQRGKLDFKLVKAILAGRPELLSKLPRNIRQKNGSDPDAVAAHFGFDTAAEMLVAMAEADSESATVKRLTDEAVDALFGSLMEDQEALAKAASEALHNGKIENFHTRELRKLSNKANRPVPVRFMENARAFAREEIGKKTVRDLRSAYQYQQAEQRAIKEMLDATSRNDWAAAADAKQRQILNHLLYRESVKAKGEIDKIHRYIKPFTTLDKRKKLGLAGPEYRDAMDALLEGVELKKISRAAAGRRKTLKEQLDYMVEVTGQNVVIPDDLQNEANLKNYEDMTLDEFRGLRDAVKNIATLARNKDLIQTEQKMMEEALAQDALITAVHLTRADTPQKEMYSDGPMDKMKSWLKTVDASLLKMEVFFQQLDGQEYGMWQQLIFEPIATAQKRAFEMKQQLNETLVEPLMNLPRDQVARLSQKHILPGVEGKLTGWNVMAIALNLGNESNIDKLVRGQNMIGANWDADTILEEVDKILTAEDWEVVQLIWDQVDQYWDDLAGVAERTTGVKPPKVKAQPVESKHGTFAGGYYPIIVDPRATTAAKRRGEKQDSIKFESNLMFNNVAHGFTEQRTGDAKPLLFEFDRVGGHLGEVIHYITHYEAIDSAYRLIRASRVEDAFKETGGTEYYDLLKPWLQAVANQGQSPEGLSVWSKITSHLATGVSVTTMGFNLSTVSVQFLGMFSTARKTGWKNISVGLKQWLTPGQQQIAVEDSNELAQTAETIDRETARDMSRLLERYSRTGQLKKYAGDIVTAGWWMLVNVQYQVNLITWHAARHQAINEMGLDAHQSAMYADSVLRTAQTSGAVKDRAAVQREEGYMKLLTAFYSYMSALYGQTREDIRQVTGRIITGKPTSGSAKLRGAMNLFTVLFVTAIVEKAMKEGLPDDEEPPAEWLKDAIKNGTLFGFSTIPLARAGTALFTDFPFRLAPIDSILSQGVYSVKKAMDPEKGLEDLTLRDFKNITKAGMVLSPYRAPTEIFWDLAEYFNRYKEGEVEDPVRELIYGVPK